MRSLVALAGCCVLGLTACSSTTRSRGVTVGGRLLAVGGISSGTARTLAGSVRLTETTTHRTLDLVVSGDGAFRATVRPGTYELVGHSPQYGSNGYECNALKAVALTSNRVHADVYCQMK
jgi:hypothetical protein